MVHHHRWGWRAALVWAVVCASAAAQAQERPRIITPAPWVGWGQGRGGEGRALVQGTLDTSSEGLVVLEVTPEMLLDLGPSGVDLREKGVARALYAGHPDRFDQLVVMADFPVALGGGLAAGLYVPVSNEVTGIGADLGGRFEEVFDFSAAYGSGGEREGVVLLGDVSGYPSDPRAPLYGAEFSSLGLLGQETLHQFGAFVGYRDEGGVRSDLLGRSGAHWSFFFHSGGSDLEGNRWTLTEELGGGRARFESGAVGGRFSELDQYLMGLRGVEEVEERFFVIRDPVGVVPEEVRADLAPRRGAVVEGVSAELTMEMIVDGHGPRVPTARQGPKVLRQVFVLLHDPARGELGQGVARAQGLRRAWPRYFYEATDGRGRVVVHPEGLEELGVWGFATSTEGWDAELGRAEGGLGLGLLRAQSGEGGVARLVRRGLALDGRRSAYVAVSLRVRGAQGCAAPLWVRASAAEGDGGDAGAWPGAARWVLADGRLHTYTVPVSELGEGWGERVRGLALEVEGVGAGVVEVERVEVVEGARFKDTDRDGVEDAQDVCPSAPDPLQEDADEDGVGDACAEGTGVGARCDVGGEAVAQGSGEGCGCGVGGGGGARGWWAWGALSLWAATRRRGGPRGRWSSAPG